MKSKWGRIPFLSGTVAEAAGGVRVNDPNHVSVPFTYLGTVGASYDIVSESRFSGADTSTISS